MESDGEAMTHPDWLQRYVERGFRLVFYPTKRKGPIGAEAAGWNTRTYTLDDYHDGDNVGVMTGHEIQPGRFLVDVDFDWTDGVPLAKRLLPPTGFGFGRTSRQISHAFYTTSTPTPSFAFDDINGHPLVELRGTKTDGSVGLQSMVPPSIHPSGELVELRKNEDIGHDDALPRRVLLYAIACLLFQHLGPRGLLHDVRLATAGFLLGLGLTEDEVVLVCESVAEVTGNNTADARVAVHSTAERLQRREKVVGAGSLAKAIGDDGKKVISRIREWLGENEFVTDSRDRPLPNCEENLLRAFDKLGVSLSFDLFSQKGMIKWPTLDYAGPFQDHVRNEIWLNIDRRFGFRPAIDYYSIVIMSAARKNSFHPVRDYLNSLTWDGTPRVDTWLVDYAGAANTEYVRKVSGITLLAAVKRVVEPGCKFDEILVLESTGQGLNKSTALKAMCPEETWFSDDLPLDVDAKQIIERTSGKWLIEAAELSGMHASRMEHLKAMLSRQVDGPVRMAYARDSIEQPRQFIIIGTTNSHNYLSDPTGNRRFWPVRIINFDVERLREVRDQIWAEALHRVKQHESIRLPPHLYEHANFQQERRRVDDPWEVILSAYFNDQPDPFRIAPDEIWEILGISNDRLTEASQRRVSVLMQKLNFRRMTVRSRNHKAVKGWARGVGQRDPVQLALEEETEQARRREEEAREANMERKA